SSNMPTDRPTISRISVTSTATATTLIMVRNGRCTRLARIIRFITQKLDCVGRTSAGKALLPSPVVNRKLEAGIGWEQFADLAQALGQRIRRQQWIIALAEVLIIHIEIQRKRIHGDGIGKGGQQIFVLGLLGLGAIGARNFA